MFLGHFDEPALAFFQVVVKKDPPVICGLFHNRNIVLSTNSVGVLHFTFPVITPAFLVLPFAGISEHSHEAFFRENPRGLSDDRHINEKFGRGGGRPG